MFSYYFVPTTDLYVFYDVCNKAGINIDCNFLHVYKPVPRKANHLFQPGKYPFYCPSLAVFGVFRHRRFVKSSSVYRDYRFYVVAMQLSKVS